MINQDPEQKARDAIDNRLRASGWEVQDMKQLDWSKGLGIAVKEYPTKEGPADYALFVDGEAVGIIEAKRDEEGHRLTMTEEQSARYADSKLKHINNKSLPFRFEATSLITRFTNMRDPAPRSREIFSFYRPETLQKWMKQEKSLRTSLFDLPILKKTGLRQCQFIAINNLEQSFKENRPHALMQMATGAGKTFTAVTFIYRLLKFAKAERILFLVDTKNLGEQAEEEFHKYIPTDENRNFTELYGVTRLQSNFIPNNNQVYISTIQRLYSILKKEPLDAAAEEINPNEIDLNPQPPKGVVYDPKIPIEFFDFIVIDECHRSIYNIWRQTLEYFDSFLIGLTATPDKRTYGFFNENLVSEYKYEDSVIDQVNVPYSTFVIDTEISRSGGKIPAKEFVDKRERLTRKKRWEQLEESLVYTPKQLDREVVNPSAIRTVIKTFKNTLPEIFPGRVECPKTLIFAKTDSHADDIITIVREEFAEGNSFCKKITCQTADPKSTLSDFRNEYNPRIAVTVDMIATGTDVKPIECLLFMRDVRSKNYFEQMIGRGVRSLDEENLKKVSQSAKSAKTHFVLIDAVGVINSQKTEMRSFEKKPSVPMKDLLAAVLMGNQEEAVFSSLAGRLLRLGKQLNETEKQEFQRLAKGHTINDLAKTLLNAHDPDIIENYAQEKFAGSNIENMTTAQKGEIQTVLTNHARTILNGELNTFIEKVRLSHEQVIDHINLDNLKYAGWHTNKNEQNEKLVREFKDFIEAYKDEITALKIFYNQPYRRKEITYQMINEIYEKLQLNKPYLAPIRVYQAYAELENSNTANPKTQLIAIVALIRHITGADKQLTDYSCLIDKNFQDWVFRKQSGAIKFNQEQMEWLRMIKDHIASSFHIEREDLDLAPFDAKGGLAKMHQLFGQQMDGMIDEINEALAA